MRRLCIGAAFVLASSPCVNARAAGTIMPDSVTTVVIDWNAFNYARAVDCWTRGDFRTAADYLEQIDVTPASSFEHADRAAFLLATAYLRLHDARAFDRVAARAGSGNGSPYRRWIRYCALIESPPHTTDTASAPQGFAGGEVMEAALLLEGGNATAALAVLDASKPADAVASIHFYLRALARTGLGQDASSDWEALAQRKPQGAAEADLIGRAAIELATARLAQPESATSALDLTPKQSRYYARALQLRALLAIEHGDTTTAGNTLRTLQHDHPGAEGSRDTQLALGAMMTDHAYWYAALRYFEAASNDWQKESSAVGRLERGEDVDAAWSAWQSRDNWNDEIRLAPEALLARAGSIADASLALGTGAPDPVREEDARSLWPSPATAIPDSAAAFARHTPNAGEWERVRGIEQAAVLARADLAQETARYQERTTELERRGRYLDRGARAAQTSADTLQASITRLNALISRLDAALAELTHVRDAALAHVTARTREMVTQLQDEVVFMQALRHFWVDGPQSDRPETFPPGFPSTADVLAHEQVLALQAEQFLEFFATHYAGVIRVSFDREWRPHLVENSRRLHGEFETEIARARAIDASIDSSRALLAHDAELAATAKRRDALASRLDSLDVAAVKTRREIAVAVAVRARATLTGEREAIDYHLADAAYEIAVEACTDSVTAEKTETTAPLRDQALARLQKFITDYPSSPAHAQGRYRLADLELLAAREEFRARMAGFLGGAPDSKEIQNRSLAPFVNYGPAIEQYEAILREDPSFTHTDAVLFNLGMILADDGRPDAMTYLQRLVTNFPASPDVQEAWLRMGNDRFDARDFAAAIPLFTHAVQGGDASFTAMAFYKLGWSQFEQEHFDDAVDSFARLIDHYDHHAEIARKIDLRQEAEECLVHTLARAGGAPAFTRYFDRVGHRDYESRLLASLASLFRGSSLYAEAAECETLWLARYPDDPAAFATAGRLVDTYQQWNKPELARDAKRAQADRFLPGTAWYRAQKDDHVRAEATDFARSAYRETAAYQHAQARKSNQPAQWREALAQYDAYLKYWPDANDSPRLHLLASDAAAHLEAYPAAMRHLSASMTSDSLSLVHDAAWQRVAVADAWYRRSQHDAHAATGSDSLAALVLKTGDEFVSRFSSDPRCADVAWRQGNVALAHGRYDDAAARLEAFGTRYPSDRRALPAVVRSADARYRIEKFESAGATYEKALAMARTARRDSLATALETTIPTCYYQAAERVAKADSTHGERDAAPMFARVARAWPRFPHADLALYRAGLGYASGKQYADATGAWEELLRAHPKSEYARDSAAQIALVTEKSGNAAGAAVAYERFAAAYPKDADAPEALLKAADLRASAGDEAGAEKTRTQFLAAFPGEVASAMQIRGGRAQKELAAIAKSAPTGAPVSSLLGKGSRSELKTYLALAAAHPDKASASILAQCDFLKAEEAHTAYAGLKLKQPLAKSIEKKKAKLEATIALYEQCSKRSVNEYTRASAHRIGQSLIEFGDALAASERPAGLSAEDLVAYNDVITEQSYVFYDRGEDAWSTLLRQSAGEADDPGRWLAQTRDALWPRLGARFLFHPEVDYPLVRATAPAAGTP